MCRATLGETLERMGLSRAFRAKVTADDGMDTRAQHLLSAAIQLQRPPNRCVVFDGSPAGITAAHNCTMKACPDPACVMPVSMFDWQQAGQICDGLHSSALADANLAAVGR